MGLDRETMSFHKNMAKALSIFQEVVDNPNAYQVMQDPRFRDIVGQAMLSDGGDRAVLVATLRERWTKVMDNS